MRYAEPIYFQKTVSGKYNPDTANYADDTPSEVKRYANITDTGEKTLQLVYQDSLNGLKQGSLTIRLQVPYKEKFDAIRARDKLYKVDFSRQQKVFVVSEVCSNA